MTRRTVALVGVCLVFGMTLVTAMQRQILPGAPMAGISAADFELFRIGLDDFLEVETAEEGLGPAFNGASCAACHNVPAVGGTSLISEVRGGARGADGSFVPLVPSGETLFHLMSIPSHGCQPILPDNATIIARRVPIPVFGAGLVEAIADATILANADPLDLNRDGVSGRAAVVRDLASGLNRIGRFGWKAQHATLLAFGADAYRNEMGITNDLFPDELAVGVDAARMRVCDPIPDPEDLRDRVTRRRGIDNFESFMKFLAPIERAPMTGAAALGDNLFRSVGCATCHVPSMQTAPNVHPLFDRKTVALFSDLLLHDIGTGDEIVQASAEAAEIRTPALWGLRLRRPLLHDGSAATIEEAIRRHRGEAGRAMEGIARMTRAEFDALLAFLKTL
jgi:CxxC motif-containing protein (DUF1111 family)